MAKTEDVFRIVEELHKEGINPTNASVRERLGGGSYATINKVLQQWRKSQRQIQEKEFQELKVNLEKIIDIAAVVETIQALTCQQAEDRVRLAQQQVEGFEQDLHAAGIRIEDLEADLTEARQENQGQQVLIADLQKQVAKLEERLDNMAVKERALVQRVDKAIEAKADAERKLMACEEEKKLIQEQVAQQREELELADEKAKGIEDIFGRFLKRMNQAARLVDRLKYDTPRNNQRKEALERVILEAEALVDRCYAGGLPKPK